MGGTHRYCFCQKCFAYSCHLFSFNYFLLIVQIDYVSGNVSLCSRLCIFLLKKTAIEFQIQGPVDTTHFGFFFSLLKKVLKALQVLGRDKDLTDNKTPSDLEHHHPVKMLGLLSPIFLYSRKYSWLTLAMNKFLLSCEVLVLMKAQTMCNYNTTETPVCEKKCSHSLHIIIAFIFNSTLHYYVGICVQHKYQAAAKLNR